MNELLWNCVPESRTTDDLLQFQAIPKQLVISVCLLMPSLNFSYLGRSKSKNYLQKLSDGGYEMITQYLQSCANFHEDMKEDILI